MTYFLWRRLSTETTTSPFHTPLPSHNTRTLIQTQKVTRTQGLGTCNVPEESQRNCIYLSNSSFPTPTHTEKSVHRAMCLTPTYREKKGSIKSRLFWVVESETVLSERLSDRKISCLTRPHKVLLVRKRERRTVSARKDYKRHSWSISKTSTLSVFTHGPKDWLESRMRTRVTRGLREDPNET